jgi:broad specificity phosphatase PhoE
MTRTVDLPRRRRIYLVRHGDVSYFDPSGKPFRPDTVPLNDEGRRQAQILAKELAPLPIDRVVASDLARCVETATILCSARGLPVTTHSELREIQPGRLADVPVEIAEKAFLHAFGVEIGPESQFLGGETFASLLERVERCFATILADTSWRQLLLVAHGGVNRVILTRALGSGLRGFASLEQDPACLNIVDVDSAGRAIVRLINHTPYNHTKVGLELTTMERLFLQYRGGMLASGDGTESQLSR